MSILLASSLIATSTIELPEKSLVWTPEEIMKTKIISDIQLSPDNETALFVATEAKMNEEKGVSVSRIYKSDSFHKINATPFSTIEYSSSQPRWSPNNLYLIHAHGGEAIPLTKEKKNIQTFSWAPNAKKIAFVMSDEIEEKKGDFNTNPQLYRERSPINWQWQEA